MDSLRAHATYLRGLGRAFDPEQFVRSLTAMAGPAIGVPHAVAFGRIQLRVCVAPEPPAGSRPAIA